jgi:hypothetical protein
MDSQTQPEVPKTKLKVTLKGSLAPVPKPERKVVIAHYAINEAFKIPDGIDLDNDKQVKDWGVKWNTLYIYMVDGTEIEVEGVGYYDYKRPQDATIEDASDWNLDEDDEED